MRSYLRHIALLLSLSLSCHMSMAQFFKKLFSTETDTNYIVDYSRDLTMRLFGSQKSASFRFRDGTTDRALSYLPNEALMLGIGANHGILGVNIGFNIPFINNDNDRFGNTEYTNLTTRIIARKIFIDVIFQKYKGYYLVNSYEMIRGWPSKDEYMIRDDLSAFSTGVSAQYIFNSKRFSYRAGFLQNEWQKKSAGSFLAGGEVYYHEMKSDSSMVPTSIRYGSFFDNANFRKVNIFAAGPIIGYAYTFVVKKHWFLSLALTVNLALGYSRLHPEGQGAEFIGSGLTLNFTSVPKLSFGYNSKKWCFAISYTNLSQRNQSPTNRDWIQFDTGNFRFNIVRRFTLKKPLRILNPGMDGWGS